MRGKRCTCFLFAGIISLFYLSAKAIPQQNDAIILFNMRQVFINPDGTTWAYTKRTLQANTNEAIQKYSTVKLSFDPETDAVFVKPPEKIAATIMPIQTLPLPDLTKEFSAYPQKNVKDISITLPLKNPGDIATYEILLKRKPLLKNAFSAVQLFGDELPIKQSTFSITFPETFFIYYQLSNIQLTPQIETKNGMKTYIFSAQNLPALLKNTEGFISESTIPRLVISSMNSWG